MCGDLILVSQTCMIMASSERLCSLNALRLIPTGTSSLIEMSSISHVGFNVNKINLSPATNKLIHTEVLTIEDLCEIFPR